MKLFNTSHTYHVNKTTNHCKLDSGGDNSKLISSIKTVKNTSNSLIRSFFENNFSCGGKEKKPNMRDLISKSYVVPDSGNAATNNFVNTPRFNGVVREVTTNEKIELVRDSNSIMNGNIRPLIGKGILSRETKNDNFPLVYDYIRSDKENESLNKNTSNLNFGIESYNGDKVKSAEIIPGTPMGNYYNKQTFHKNLNIVQLDNGNCGTVGFRFDINQLTPDKPLLIHGGELSGCTMIYALKDNYFYAFHSGQPGNDKTLWETEIDGSKSIIDSHAKMTGATPPTGLNIDIEALSNYLHNNFDFSMMAFCGHGGDILRKENVLSFDYNKPSDLVGINNSRVANAMAVLVNEKGVIKIDMLSDDMKIDKNTLKSESITHVMSGPIEKPVDQAKN